MLERGFGISRHFKKLCDFGTGDLAAPDTSQGGADPPPQTVNVTNAGEGTLSGLSTTVTPATASWLQEVLLSPTAPTTLGLNTIPRLVSVGTHTVKVTVTSSDPSVASESVDVELVVLERCGGE